MTTITATWRDAFNAARQSHFAITIEDAGLTDTELSRYADLEPKEAALQFGDDYDLDRVDRGGADTRKGPSGPSTFSCLTKKRAALRVFQL